MNRKYRRARAALTRQFKRQAAPLMRALAVSTLAELKECRPDWYAKWTAKFDRALRLPTT